MTDKNLILISIICAALAILYYNYESHEHTLSLPPPPPLTGPLKPKLIKDGTKLLENKLFGPESIVYEKKDTLYTCLQDGRCVKIVKGTIEKTVRLTQHTDCDGNPNKWFYCGRPLGLRQFKNNEFLVVDAILGIYLVNFEKEESEVVFAKNNLVDGLPLTFPDDLDVIDNDTIIYSDVSTRYGIESFTSSFIEHAKDGRVIQLKLSTGETKVLINDLSFVNGIQMHPDKKSVIIAESATATLHRYYFDGPKKNRREIFSDNLPGFPDNLRLSVDGKSFYVALFSTRYEGRPSLFDYLAPYKFLRKIIGIVMAAFPESLKTKFLIMSMKDYGLLVEIDLNGKIINSYHDPEGKIIHLISQITDDGDKYLYLGSFSNKFIGRIKKH